jgi:hypothetical protein
MGFNNNSNIQSDPSYVHSMQVLDRIKEMHNAKASEDWSKYWHNFHSVGILISPYLDMDTKKQLQKNYNKLEKGIKEIKQKFGNDKTAKLYIQDLRTEFALTHEIFLISSLGSLDIIKKVEEGEIKIEEYDLDLLEDLIRKTKSNVEINRKLGDIEDDTDK